MAECKHVLGYTIFADGTIISSSGRRVKGTLQSKGYLQTTGRNNKKHLIHRLVAEAWCEKPDTAELLEVNHRDGNKQNNSVSNLEWVTSSENQFHKWSLMKMSKGIQ